jgi:hypothetical protein
VAGSLLTRAGHGLALLSLELLLMLNPAMAPLPRSVGYSKARAILGRRLVLALLGLHCRAVLAHR